MTRKEAERAAARAQREALRGRVRLINDASAEIQRILSLALDRVRGTLAGQPTDYQQWALPQIEREIAGHLDGMRGQMSTAAERGATAAWEAGLASVDVPLAAAGLSITGLVPQISNRQLDAMRSFMTDRIRDVTAETVNRINTQLGLVGIGAQSPSDAVTSVTQLLGEFTRDRARTIVTHNLGTVYATAAQQRAEAAAKKVPMEKVWRRSGKRKQRPGHALADGQRRALDEPFDIPDRNGVIVKMMYPHDPKAPIGETINCGCTVIYKPIGWNSSGPDRVPFRADELKDNVELRALLGMKK